MVDDERFVREALEEARAAAASGNRPFGSVLVLDGEVIRRAQNSTVTDDDIAAHPEFKLARWAAASLEPAEIAESTLYTSTEPCPMCTGAVYWSGLRRVVFSCSSADKAEFAGPSIVMSCTEIFDNAVDDVEVIGHVLHDEGRAIHESFWSSTHD